MEAPSDADLVHAARAGDISGLAVLLERHRAGMTAVAIGVLGAGPDAEDAVQEAALVAVEKLADVRDPAAVGAWLRTIVRNICRASFRAPVPVTLHPIEPFLAGDRGPEETLEQHELSDWIWGAVEQLTEPLRTVVLLRHFSNARSYEQIAALCGIPVGTVRSRLHEARRRLVTALDDSAAVAHPDVRALTDHQCEQFEDLLASAERDDLRRHLVDGWAADVRIVAPDGATTIGWDVLVEGMAEDLAAGVRQRAVHLTASRDVTVVEAELLSPDEDPDHCPPHLVWLIQRSSGRVGDVRLLHAVDDAS
jgi:RNA polymerase sigma factor (sigma-70 family)